MDLRFGVKEQLLSVIWAGRPSVPALRCPTVTSYPADVPCPCPLDPSSDLFNHVCDLCLSFTHMFVSLSRYVIFNILLPIFVCATASLVCLAVQCHCICATCHCWHGRPEGGGGKGAVPPLKNQTFQKITWKIQNE